MSRQQLLERIAELEAENFNLKYPVGTEGHLRKDSGKLVAVATKYPAGTCGSQAVGYFTGISGAYMLSRFTPDQGDSDL